MPVPRRRRSKAKKGMNRAHKSLDALQNNNCPKCHAPKLSHRACPACGHYAGRDYRTSVTKT